MTSEQAIQKPVKERNITPIPGHPDYYSTPKGEIFRLEPVNVQANAFAGRFITCPYCEGEVLIHYGVEVTKVETKPKDGDSPKANAANSWRASLSQDQSAILDAAIRTGLFDSFLAALERGPHAGLPDNKEKFFLNWFKLARPKLIPNWALDEFKDLYPGTFIEFFVSQFVGAVVSNGQISLFLPVDLLTGKSVKTGMDGTKRILPPDISGVRQWVKTKMGYVPAEARIALQETRKRCIGEYARPML